MASHSLSLDQLRHLRLRAQRLSPRSTQPDVGVAALVKGLCGVQAQEPAAAALAVRVRSTGLRAADVEHARVDERSIVRTWAMRGTLHLLPTEDLGWLLALLGPQVIRQAGRRYAELGLDEEIRVRAVHAIRDVLGRHGPLTRAELAGHLAERGLPTEGQATYHLLHHAGVRRVVCFGPDRDGEATFVLLEDWVEVGDPLPHEAARAELARRYLGGYGPAGPEDFAAWSGLPMGEARGALASIAQELVEVEAAQGRGKWLLKGQLPWLDEPGLGQPVVRLLPGYDPYLLGYQNRDLVVPQAHARRVHPGGGLIRPTLLVDGRAAGTWKTQGKRGGLEVVVESFEGLGAEVRPRLEAEVQDVGRFLEVEVVFRGDEALRAGQ